MAIKDWKDLPESILTKIVKLGTQAIYELEYELMDEPIDVAEEDTESKSTVTRESSIDFVIKCANVCRPWSKIIIRKEFFNNLIVPTQGFRKFNF